MNLSRRKVLGWGTLLSASAAGAAFGFHHFASARVELPEDLIPDPKGLLDLPRGYRYRILAQTGDMMSDGRVRRDLPDGAACASLPGGQIVLMCNHECDENGGVSRVVLDEKTLEVVSTNDVLTGTLRNCAGGPSPWGWLSCEEVDEGGVWLCPWESERTLAHDKRVRIADYGTFRHEAVCIDPDSFIAYLTEDDGPSHIYRMVPTDRAHPFKGRLQALVSMGPGIKDTATMTQGESFQFKWVNVDPAHARATARKKNAAVFHRGEGIWFFDGVIYFTATANNQLFKLVPSGDGGTVSLITSDLICPDNVTVAPWGDLVVAEDQKGYSRLRLVSPDGKVRTLAKNAVGPGQELAGVCFSPRGETLFCNLQRSGQTLAITGPFPS